MIMVDEDGWRGGRREGNIASIVILFHLFHRVREGGRARERERERREGQGRARERVRESEKKREKKRKFR